jgi:hypothetical protein
MEVIEITRLKMKRRLVFPFLILRAASQIPIGFIYIYIYIGGGRQEKIS